LCHVVNDVAEITENVAPEPGVMCRFLKCHNIYKRAKASEIMFGDANYHREEIARKVVDGEED